MEQRTEITNSSISPALPRQRIWELDFIRGLCVALMILDHLFYDLGFVFPQQWFADGGSGIIYDICYFARNFYWDWPVRHIIRVMVLAGFIGSCGISCSLSRSNLKRGLKLLAVALALSGATALMDLIMDQQSFLSALVFCICWRSRCWPMLG